MNFAVKSDIALTFLNAHEVPLSERTEIDPVSVPDVAEMATKITVLVRCNQFVLSCRPRSPGVDWLVRSERWRMVALDKFE